MDNLFFVHFSPTALSYYILESNGAVPENRPENKLSRIFELMIRVRLQPEIRGDSKAQLNFKLSCLRYVINKQR